MDKTRLQLEFKSIESGSKKDKVEVITNSEIYAKKSDNSYLLGLDYLILWKAYPEEKNTWELVLIIYHLERFVTIFHKEYPEKPITAFQLINSA